MIIDKIAKEGKNIHANLRDLPLFSFYLFPNEIYDSFLLYMNMNLNLKICSSIGNL